MLTKLDGGDAPLELSERAEYEGAVQKLSQAMLSHRDTHEEWLVRQGMSRSAAKQHASHRFGGF